MSDGSTATAANPADQVTPVTTPAVPAPAAGATTPAEGGGELPAGAAAPAAAPENQPAEPPKGGLEKRFSELTRKAREAERIAAEERAAREAAEMRLQALMTPPDEPLEPPSFETPEQFQRDMALYTQQLAERASREAVQAEQARQAEDQARRAQQAQADSIRASFQERVEAARPELQDYDEVVSNPDLPISVPLAAAIAQHPLGPRLAYHLGKNPGEAARIAKLPVALQLMELGDLAHTLKNPALNVSTAPPPITPVRGGAPATSQNLDGMSMEEYAASRNRR